jgi:Mn-containing catalase
LHSSRDGVGDIDNRTTSTTSRREMLEELLVETLRDLLHAEGQLVKALPKMADAATSDALKGASTAIAKRPSNRSNG